MEENQVIPPPVTPAPVVNSYSVPATDSIPDEIKGWSWGGFLWSWIWAVGNNTWIGLLALVPGLSLIMSIVLGVKGREWSWKNKHWDSVEDFKRVQHNWVKWWFIIMLPLTLLFIAFYAFVIILAVNPSAQIEKARQLQLQNQTQISQPEQVGESVNP
jgi:hypothetical protein